MTNKKNWRDPRGHSIRIYSDVFDSPSYMALSPHDILAYLALLRELKATNNGDLSLPLSRAKKCGIKHHMTLARSLRALCAVGLVALTRKGGCTKGGQRLPNLYRMTDRECFAIPAKYLEAMRATNEWKLVTTIQHGLDLVLKAESRVKGSLVEAKCLGQRVTATTPTRDVVLVKTRTPYDTWNNGLDHGVTLVENTVNTISMRASDDFSPRHKT